MRIDLHTHSSVSDGTDTPTQLVRKAAEAGVDVLGLTDHDTFDGLREARLAAESAGVLVLPGIEMSCQLDGASVHLLGYGCDPHFEALLDELADSDLLHKARARLARKSEAIEVDFDDL